MVQATRLCHTQRGLERATAGRVWARKRMAAVEGADGDLQGELSTVIQSLRVYCDRMSRRPTTSTERVQRLDNGRE
jgi:hypothetical protein